MAVESVETALKSESGFMGVNRQADKAGQVLHRQKLGSHLWWLGVWVTQAAAGWWLCCCLAMFFCFFLSRSIHPSTSGMSCRLPPKKLGSRNWACVVDLWVVEGVSGCPLRSRSGYVLIGSVELGWLCHLPTCPVLLFQGRFVFLRMSHGAWPSFSGEARPPI